MCCTIICLTVCSRNSLRGSGERYLDYSLIARQVFGVEVFAVALHPSGLHILVGCSDRLRLMHVTRGSLKPANELPLKNVMEVRSSGI
jgi:cilia- and flagella-associated protein 57